MRNVVVPVLAISAFGILDRIRGKPLSTVYPFPGDVPLSNQHHGH